MRLTLRFTKYTSKYKKEDRNLVVHNSTSLTQIDEVLSNKYPEYSTYDIK